MKGATIQESEKRSAKKANRLKGPKQKVLSMRFGRLPAWNSFMTGELFGDEFTTTKHPPQSCSPTSHSPPSSDGKLTTFGTPKRSYSPVFKKNDSAISLTTRPNACVNVDAAFEGKSMQSNHVSNYASKIKSGEACPSTPEPSQYLYHDALFSPPPLRFSNAVYEEDYTNLIPPIVLIPANLLLPNEF